MFVGNNHTNDADKYKNEAFTCYMIGKDAHKELWSKVWEWLKKRS